MQMSYTGDRFDMLRMRETAMTDSKPYEYNRLSRRLKPAQIKTSKDVFVGRISQKFMNRLL